MKFRNLELVRVIIQEATGLEITYAYEDLVFPDNMAFLIQFDDNQENNFFCHFHEDSDSYSRKSIIQQLKQAAENNKSTVLEKGVFTLNQKDEEVEIKFKVA